MAHLRKFVVPFELLVAVIAATNAAEGYASQLFYEAEIMTEAVNCYRCEWQQSQCSVYRKMQRSLYRWFSARKT